MTGRPLLSTEHKRYAGVLEVCARIGVVALILAFAGYALGVLDAQVPPQDLPRLWSLPLAEYLRASGSPTGWQWLGRLEQGDMLSLAGIAWLAGCSMLCLLAVAPLYWRRGERVSAGLCVAVVAVLVLAASGVIGAGH